MIEVVQQILANPAAVGFGAAGVAGALAYHARQLPQALWDTSLRSLTVELTVSSSDESYGWLERWLAIQPYASKSRRVELKSFETPESWEAGRPKPDWVLTLGFGTHVFWWGNRPVYVSKQRENEAKGTMTRPLETIHLRTVGRSQDVVRRLIDEARKLVFVEDELIVRYWRNGYWTGLSGQKRRPLDSVILRDGQLDRIIADLNHFRSAREWYERIGVPYRRGYLLSGPPGTGKTSAVMALAGYLGCPLCVLNLGSLTTDEDLFNAILTAPAGAILLLEDVDCAGVATTRQQDEDGAKSISLGALLNVLDGVLTPSGRIYVMTTNHPDRLDPALIRPGRADVHERFALLGPVEQASMARRFYGDVAFAPFEQTCAPALLQSGFMAHPNDPVAAREYIEESMAA